MGIIIIIVSIFKLHRNSLLVSISQTIRGKTIRKAPNYQLLHVVISDYIVVWHLEFESYPERLAL